jgi:hypothetical protein
VKPVPQEELHDYYRLLAVLEQELHCTPGAAKRSAAAGQELRSGPGALLPSRLLTSTTADGRDGSSSGGGGGSGTSSGLTLLRLRAWLQEPIERCVLTRTVFTLQTSPP